MFDAVLFDLDGTLADTAKDLTDALNFVLIRNGKMTLDYQTVRPYAAFGSAKLIELGFGKTDDKNLTKQLLDYYESNIVVKTEVFKGINSVLKILNKNNIKFGVVTNKPKRFTNPLLKKLAINTPCIISGDTCEFSKPDPAPILKACKILNCNPPNTLFVGDSYIDVKAANAANTPIIVAKYGYLTETRAEIDKWDILGIINKPEDLLGYLQ